METPDLGSLRRGIRDLVALTTLPAIWARSQPQAIAESLSEVLLELLRLDFVYLRVKHPIEATSLDLIRTKQQLITGIKAQETGKTFDLLEENSTTSTLSIADPFNDGLLQIRIIPLGHEKKYGFAVVGLQPPSSLTDLDHMLLSVATNQGVIALQQAHLLTDLQSALAKEHTARLELQQTAEQIALLHDLTARLSQSGTLEQIARAILQACAKLFDGNRRVVYAVREDKRALHILACYPQEENEMSVEDIPLSTSMPATDALHTEKIVWIENADQILNQYPSLQPIATEIHFQAIIVVPFFIDERSLGCLELNFPSPRVINAEEINLLSAVARQCAQAWERARLTTQAQVAATVEERHRLARDLHDAVSQVLFASTTMAESVPRTWERDPQQALNHLNQVVTLNRAAMAEMRTLLLELRPEAIVNRTLNQLLLQLVEAAQGRRQVKGQLTIEGIEQPIPSDVHVALYRITQEGISNLLKHSGTDNFRVYLQHQHGQIQIRIRDNGVGFDSQQQSSGFGLGSMRERAEMIDATFQITSTIGQGTEINICWPS